MSDANPTLPPNMTQIGGVYVVRTQAGYWKALKDFLRQTGWKLDELVDRRETYGPYPAVVTFDTFYNGGTYALVHSWTSAADYKKRAELILAALAPA